MAMTGGPEPLGRVEDTSMPGPSGDPAPRVYAADVDPESSTSRPGQVFFPWHPAEAEPRSGELTQSAR